MTGSFIPVSTQPTRVLNPPLTPVTYMNGWVDFGSGYAPMRYRRLPTGTVEVSGVIKSGTGQVTSLPFSCSPSGSLVLLSATSNGSDTFAHVGVGSNGAVTPNSAGAFLSFSWEFTASGDVGVFLGDSITAGTGASDNAHRWSTLVATALGLTEDNEGISGTLLQDTGGTSNNGYSTRAARVNARYPQYLFVLYGINDVDYNGGTSVSTFQAELTTIVSDAMTYGVPASRIVIGTLPFVDATKQTSGTGVYGAPFNAGTTARILQYNAAVKTVAASKATRVADVYTAMANGGGTSLLNSDGLHPNDTGHALIASTFQAALT